MNPSTRFLLVFFTSLFGFLTIATVKLGAFPISATEYGRNEPGVYVVQTEGQKPELCFSISKIVEKILDFDEDAKIVRFTYGDKTSSLIVFLSDATSLVIPIQSGEIVCESLAVDRRFTILLKENAENPENVPGMSVSPVWPQQAE